MPSLWVWGTDYQGQPLYDAWWTPGWTSQNEAYIQVPNAGISNPGFPPNLNYVTLTGKYFDTSANPISGYLTFWPSSPLLFNINGSYTYMPQRYAGLNFSLLGVNQMGDGKIYLQYGQLLVSLLATDNVNMNPTSFTYHVKENFEDGLQYDITAPSADDSTIQDIRTLIIPGSERPVTDDDDCILDSRVEISSISTQYLVSDASYKVPPNMSSIILSNYPVDFAFISGNGIPDNSTTWYTGSWATTTLPYLAQILIGPGGTSLPIGSYRVWLKITITPQVPVFSVGYLDIF